MEKYVCIDIGGTAIKYGLMDESGNILNKASMKTEARKGGKAILNKAISIVEKYKNDYIINGICISTAGMVDVEKGEIFYSAPLIPDYTGTNFKKTMEEKFSVPCEVENDVNCACLAEFNAGAAKGSKSAVMLTVGTGIGGAAILNGEIYHGFSGSAMEVGYMHIGGKEFQAQGAASVLGNRVAQRKNEPRENWNGYKIFEYAQKGDKICIDAIDEMVEVLAEGIANICYVLNPQVVVLGGGIMEQTEYLKPKMEKALDSKLNKALRDNTKLEFAQNRNDAGMIGAFYNFKLRQGK